MDESTPPTTAETPAKQAENAFSRVSVVVSAITAVSTLIITIASDAISAPWLLAGATVTSAICFGILFFSFDRAKQGKVHGFFKLASVLCAVVLGLGWLFVYRDDLWFSRFMAAFFAKPVVVIDDAVAHSVVSSKSGSLSKERRLMSVLDKLVQEPHHTVVQRVSDPMPPHSLLFVTGVAMPARSSLIIEVPGSRAEPKLSEATARQLDSVRSLVAAAAGEDRFLASAFDSGPLRISVASSPQEMSELVTMGYHAITGVELARQGSPVANEHFLRLHDFRELVTPEQLRGIPWLAEALLFAAHRALSAGDSANAATFIDDGNRLLPDNGRLRVADAYLKLLSGHQEIAAQMLKGENIESGDPKLPETLRGLVDFKGGNTWAAIGHFESAGAIDSTDTPAGVFVMHTLITLLTAETDASAEERGPKILEHAKAAERALPGVPLTALLSGFGSALVGDSASAELAFARARRLAKSAAEVESCDYWEAWGLAQSATGLPKAIQMLDDLDHKGNASPRLLGLLAELNALDLYGTNNPSHDLESKNVRRAFEIARRALDLNKQDVRANRVLGLYQAAQAATMKGPQRDEMMESAIGYFDVALAEGGDDSRIYQHMSWLYRDLARTADSKRSERRAYDISCQREHDAGSCAIRDVQALLEQKNRDAARERTNDLLRWLTARSYISASWGNSILNTMALIFYQHEDAETASELYRVIRRNISRQKSLPQESMAALVDCNEGFIYVDSRRTSDAERLFRRGLSVSSSPDCEAGLAITLKQAGRGPEALALIHSARRQDPNYGNFNVLKQSYYWSDTALSLARSFDRVAE